MTGLHQHHLDIDAVTLWLLRGLVGPLRQTQHSMAVAALEARGVA